MRTMALDYGDARIGVAVTDPTGMLAQPLETIEHGARRSGGRKKRGRDPLARIAELVGELEVERIVVGLPLELDGSTGPQARKSRGFGERVAKRTGVAVEYFDERWTSREAERVLEGAGVRARERKGRVDPIAAALILRAWLESTAP